MPQNSSQNNALIPVSQALSAAFPQLAKEFQPLASFLRQLSQALAESEFGAFLRWYHSVIPTGYDSQPQTLGGICLRRKP